MRLKIIAAVCMVAGLIHGSAFAETLVVYTPSGKVLTIEIELTETVRGLKDEIALLEDMPVNRQKLSFLGKALPDSFTLADCRLADQSIILLSVARWGY